MRELVDYKKIKKVWRHKLRDVYVPIYRDLGKGGSRDKTIRAKER